jgi:hypothetical protein
MSARLIFVLLFMAVAAPTFGQQAYDMSSLFGDWTGESKCVGNNPYCHNEVVVYHISRSKSDAAKVNISADKIVNGTPESMGDLDFTYDSQKQKQTLTAEFTISRTGGKGVWVYQINGNHMDGTLTTYPENEIGRRAKVDKKTAKE